MTSLGYDPPPFHPMHGVDFEEKGMSLFAARQIPRHQRFRLIRKSIGGILLSAPSAAQPESWGRNSGRCSTGPVPGPDGP
jgi:hypothetical protein